MSTHFKYQEAFSNQLFGEWLGGDTTGVRTKIRNLKNKEQAAYIASQVTFLLANHKGLDDARLFAEFMHPNNR